MIRIGQRFNPLQRLLHWLMAVCIIAMFFIWRWHGVHRCAEVPAAGVDLIKSLGIGILVLALIRLAYACAMARRRCRRSASC